MPSFRRSLSSLSSPIERRATSLWANPRAASTAVMYSFAERSDTCVVDEPLYAYWLRANPELKRPYREELLNGFPDHGDEVVRKLLHDSREKPHIFMKQLSKFLDKELQLDRSFLDQSRNVILTRHPRELLISFHEAQIAPSLAETGLVQQVELFEEYGSSQDIPVLLNHDIVANPEAIMRALCKRLDLDFEEGMLSWKKGGRPEDGIWAKHWYHGSHKSTGFGKANQSSVEKYLPPQFEGLLAQCMPYYEKLEAAAMKV